MRPSPRGVELELLAFAGCSAAAAATAMRANLRPTIPLLARLIPTAASIACFALAISLALHD